MDPLRLIKAPAGTANVLVVDDDDAVRRLMTSWLRSGGYRVRAVGGALAALDEVRAEPVDVAICDIRMEGPSGVWLIEQLCQECPATAIIVATGLPEMDPAVTLRPGVTGYLTKPFNRDTVLSAVQGALR